MLGDPDCISQAWPIVAALGRCLQRSQRDEQEHHFSLSGMQVFKALMLKAAASTPLQQLLAKQSIL